MQFRSLNEPLSSQKNAAQVLACCNIHFLSLDSIGAKCTVSSFFLADFFLLLIHLTDLILTENIDSMKCYF